MPTGFLGRDLSTDRQGSEGYMGIVIDCDSGDSIADISMTLMISNIYNPINLLGYASRI